MRFIQVFGAKSYAEALEPGEVACDETAPFVREAHAEGPGIVTVYHSAARLTTTGHWVCAACGACAGDRRDTRVTPHRARR